MRPTVVNTVYDGRCHCGAVRFEVHTPNGIGALNRCNCSICRRKGAIMASIPMADFRLTAGADKLSLYQWNTRTAEHYFCSVCGIYTHHRRRSEPQHYAINVGCLDGPDPTAGRTIGMFDGASNTLVGDHD